MRIPLRCLVLALCAAAALGAFAFDAQKLRAAYLGWVAGAPESRFAAWTDLIGAAKPRPVAERLARVNDFFNQRVRFVDDIDLYGQGDYWATPMETLARAAGDCEDFAIAKYYTLLQLGIPVDRLRLTYVRARLSSPGGPLSQAHMVLAYYASPDAEPLVLDNLVTQILPASRRPDLTPVFNFNSERIYQAGPRGASTGVNQLSRWDDLLRRARDEGFD